VLDQDAEGDPVEVAGRRRAGEPAVGWLAGPRAQPVLADAQPALEVGQAEVLEAREGGCQGWIQRSDVRESSREAPHVPHVIAPGRRECCQGVGLETAVLPGGGT